MEKKNNKYIGIFASIFLLIILVGASFAYMGLFSENMNNKVEVNIYAKGNGDTSFTANSSKLLLDVPIKAMFEGNTGLAEENTAVVSVNLTGAEGVLTTCTYDLVFEYDLNSEVYGQSVPVTQSGVNEITLKVSSPNGTNNYATEKNFNYDSSWTAKTTSTGAKKTLVEGITIKSTGTSTIQNINITGRYYNLDANQEALGDKSFKGTLYVENNKCTVEEITPSAKDIILTNNGGEAAIKAKGTPDFTKTSTTNEGMYAMEDDLGTSYYFRGAVDNNWVKFGKDSSGNDMYWRIIRINGDGSVRMIYTGTTAPTESTKVVMTGEGTQIGTSVFNSSFRSSEYVGYMYTLGEQHGTSTDSTIKTTLDNWYKTTTLETDASTKALVSDQIFCNDRTASTSTTGTYGEISSWASTGTNYYYGAYGRLFANSSNPSPSLKCTIASDKFTVNSSNGNGALTYPVGLITADEIMLAGSNNNYNGNSNYYLYTDSTYWSFSPKSWDGSFALSLGAAAFGSLDSSSVTGSDGVRGVISLSSEVKLSGDGTWNNVYTVS